jgi:protein TonB
MPEYPGGSEAMNSFIVDHLKYPTLAKDNNVEGKVIAQFVVTKTGDVTDIKILRDIGSGCGEEVMRVLKLMPKWIPGKNKRKTVDVYLTLPIEFTLAQ